MENVRSLQDLGRPVEEARKARTARPTTSTATEATARPLTYNGRGG